VGEAAFMTKCAEHATRFKISKKRSVAIVTELHATAEKVLHPARIKGKALIAKIPVRKLPRRTSSRLPSSSAFVCQFKKIGSRSSLHRANKDSQFNKELLHLLIDLTNNSRVILTKK